MKRQHIAPEEADRLTALLRYEASLWAEGFSSIAGVDEAGMGAIAGPVIAGAVVLRRGYRLAGIDDSKRLSHEQRAELAHHLKAEAAAWATGLVTAADVDRLGIFRAGLLAMERAVDGLPRPPDVLLIDGRKRLGLRLPQKGIVRGDSLSMSIAAGSILAKTTRDALMTELHTRHPNYGFDIHKGYPTEQHLAALTRHGPTSAHRTSFSPVAVALGLRPQQLELMLPCENPPTLALG